AGEHAPVRPDGSVLYISQHRLREKTFLAQHGFPVTPFRAVHSADDLRAAVKELGCPAVLKTAGFGYDGKGQTRITAPEQADAVYSITAHQEMILEAFVDFERELSVVAARGMDGAFAHWGVIENTHHRHILDVSVAPAGIPPEVERAAIDMARAVLEQLKVV